MKELLFAITEGLVADPSAIQITEDAADEDGVVVLHLSVAPDDMGRVIGKQGRIAKSIRAVVKAATVKNEKPVFVEIRDKDLILFSYGHSPRTLFDHIHQQIIHDTIEILFDLLTADMSIDIQDEGLVFPDGIKDIQKSLLPGAIGFVPFDGLAGILLA